MRREVDHAKIIGLSKLELFFALVLYLKKRTNTPRGSCKSCFFKTELQSLLVLPPELFVKLAKRSDRMSRRVSETGMSL